MLFGKRDIDAIVSCGGLKLEVKTPAKTLAKSKAPGLVDASTKRSMDDQLHASSLIEKSFGDDSFL